LAELEEAVRGFLNREDIAILLIVQHIAENVRHIIDNYTKLTPAILEIPSKEHAYDPSKDFILKRAQVLFILGLNDDYFFKFKIKLFIFRKCSQLKISNKNRLFKKKNIYFVHF
jgi:hypothetical protein